MTVKTVHLSNLAIPPGELLQEEIDSRGISADVLAKGLGLTAESVAEIFCGERPVTPKIALALEQLLGVAASLWLNMEASYRLTLANNFEVYGHANPFDETDAAGPECIGEAAGWGNPITPGGLGGQSINQKRRVSEG